MLNTAYWGLPEAATDVNALKEFELKHKIYSLQVGITTNDLEVKVILRALIEPITVFGEGKYERRERLKKVLLYKYDRLFHDKDVANAITASSEAKNLYDVMKAFNIDLSNVFSKKAVFSDLAHQDQTQDAADKELFYTEGDERIKHFRSELANETWARTRKRKEVIHEYRNSTDQFEHKDDVERYASYLTDSLSLAYSHIAAERPLTAAKFAPNMKYIAVGSFCSHINVYHYKPDDNFPLARKLDNGSKEMIHCLDWQCNVNAIYDKKSAIDAVQDHELLLATGGSGGSLSIWRPFPESETEQNPDFCVHKTNLHEERVNRIRFHPFKQVILSSSTDETVRLFDLQGMEELYVQEGHSHSVHGLALNGDGNLVASGDMHGVLIIMDLRTGKHIFQQPVHNGKITAIDFHPINNHIFATAADDNAVKLFDLRKMRPGSSLLAHTKLVSDMEFEPTYGRFLATSSFDTHLKVWDTEDYKCRKVLSNNDAKVMSVNVAPDSSAIVTACYDRTLRIFKPIDASDSSITTGLSSIIHQ
ncbi:WD domain, G-beta repeat domain containing protein, putative [Babesia bigemina]|uniref:WD domain, G-beta repeat domain containing protein, putative n=1 Tax=Babesia bigemina TaxID=5866 RepID=A0A061D6J3_BABBI|nr:WD domain, G-beta repeat domain containing protein, putative [Babesia bigemina]CDR95637.1 WD domain, G-beta repeat domain containing protein, putative [Babesia bigemina]|eukprot:XP_012767823.1 WD domain, G-beta repeat domain containing protein, putative [Babesia bigemina]